ncbi:MAG: hypothetical protein H0T79_04210, partial [Deltaproteobacteria bacterium]|nr:hypothetical protein [Deltaproteobacteria bacterium]
MDDKQKEWIAWSVFGVVMLAAVFSSPSVCRSTYVKYGLVMPTCADGIVRQTAALQVSGARRGGDGYLSFYATAHYTTRDSDSVEHVPGPAVTSVAVSLTGDAMKPLALTPAWNLWEGTASAPIKLPADLPDGDYKLHADYETKLGKGSLDVPLPLYTPARIHVITDRPLYEPGNVVKFRAVVLRARDLAPLDKRPGKWVVKDPSGEILLEEKAAASDWGVVSGSFPLDKGAATGNWLVSWVSHDTSDEVAIKVQPFTLPRFRIEATASKPYYAPNETPSVKGAVTYSSGAPVPNAKVEITWNISGDWPAPLEWEATLLPRQAVVGANGRFELALPKIPADLQGRATLTANLAAVDPAGDRVEGSVAVLLSQDGIQVSAVTELENGLVHGFNNRMYLRVTTPDGRVVPNTKIKVKRAWDGNDPGIDTALDEDGVASLQIDPGLPSNIIIPPQPYRPQKRAATVTRGEAEELIDGEGASLADQVELDRWLPALAACAKWFADQNTVKVGLRVDRGGGILAASAGTDPLAQCTATVVRSKRLPAGRERLYTLSFTYVDPPLSTLSASIEATLDAPEGFDGLVDELTRSARDCLPLTDDGDLPSMLTWRATAGSKFIELGSWIPDPKVETRT